MSDLPHDPDLPTRCPICKRPVPVPPPNATREQRQMYPFCTDRCRLIDLGRWLDGAYQIPVKDDDPPRRRPAGPDDEV
jgi:endogenous inhibitor of DNA gyrase (YacG/DUF329 family)